MTTIAAIVPTYNRAALLGRALESIFAQTRPPDEVVVVDDASTDATGAVVRDFPRARLLRLERNGGAAAARNQGLRATSSEWVAFLDSDDAWSRAKLERQLAYIAATDADLVCSGIVVQTRDGTRQEYRGRGPRAASGWSFADFLAYPFCPSTWLARRRLFDEVGVFDESLRNCEDLDFLARIANRRIAVMPDLLSHKFNLPDSLDTVLDRTARSYELLFARHAELWGRAPAAAALACRRIAGMHFRAGDTASGRRALLRALRYRPLDVRALALMAASVVGIRGPAVLRRLQALLRL